MDAHAFRRISRVLAGSISGSRLERIHEPVPGIVAFSLYGRGKKQCLLFRPHRSMPYMFLTGQSPFANPAFPPAYIMRLRKYAEGRILGEHRLNWINRQMAFCLPAIEGEPERWLFIDIRSGASIRNALPPNFETDPAWPEAKDLPLNFGKSTESAATKNSATTNPWECFSVLTPRLRRSLEALDPKDSAALLVDLEDGNGDLFWYGPEGSPEIVSAWPLPYSPPSRETVTSVEPETVLPLLESMQLPLLLAEAQNIANTPIRKTNKSASKKHKRLLEKLAEEKKRLDAMFLLGDDARLLQAHLWQVGPDSRLQSITIPLDPADTNGETRTIALNPLLTVTENMEMFFKKAAKASRGLTMLAKRELLMREALPKLHSTSAKKFQLPKKSGKKASFSSSLIQEFRSSDGFLIWRGRNAEGNRALVKLANPFDLWMHVEDGPSAHLIIRRDHSTQEIPDRTLHEAAVLVGLKSWRKNDPKAPVMTALAKHVQPIKGAKAGTVRVQEAGTTILASLDPRLEDVLKKG